MPFCPSCLVNLFAPCLVRENTSTCSHSLSRIKCVNNAVFCFLSTGQTHCLTEGAAVFLGVTDISTGSFIIPFASWRISAENVAENIKFCRTGGKRFKILRMSWIKPMSSILSASSSTSTSSSSNLTALWLYKSSKRPGVATRTSTPRRNFIIWGLIFTPPKTTVERIGKFFPYVTTLSATWAASSLVGVITKART